MTFACLRDCLKAVTSNWGESFKTGSAFIVHWLFFFLWKFLVGWYENQAPRGCVYVQLTISLASVYSFEAHCFFQLHLKGAGGVTNMCEILQVLWKWLAEQRRDASAVMLLGVKVSLPGTRSFTWLKRLGEGWDQEKDLMHVSTGKSLNKSLYLFQY